jgi:hypothetical protein
MILWLSPAFQLHIIRIPLAVALPVVTPVIRGNRTIPELAQRILSSRFDIVSNLPNGVS